MGTEPDATTEFSIDVEKLDDGTVVSVVGELDLSTHDRLAEELRTIAADGETIVVDLTGCDFIDSSGIRALLLGHKATESSDGDRFALVASSPQVARVLELTGVNDAVSLYDSVEDALKQTEA